MLVNSERHYSSITRLQGPRAWSTPLPCHCLNRTHRSTRENHQEVQLCIGFVIVVNNNSANSRTDIHKLLLASDFRSAASIEYRQREERSDGMMVVIAPRERFFIGGESSVVEVASFAVSSFLCTLHIFGISFVYFGGRASSAPAIAEALSLPIVLFFTVRLRPRTMVWTSNDSELLRINSRPSSPFVQVERLLLQEAQCPRQSAH